MKLLPECNIVVVATFGFLLIGMIDIGCVVFGIVELASGDSIFLNDGLGEVLTVLGTYFTVPYLFILVSFIAVSKRLSCLPFIEKDFGTVPILAFVGVLFLIQQGVTDKYMQILRGDAMLGFIAWDIVTAAMFIYFRSKDNSPYAGFMYTIMYVSKMGAEWDYNYKTLDESFFGPNGVLAMLFLCIPIIQFPLYLGMSAGDNTSMADAFTLRFNLFLAHLLHSLDVISIYRFSFVAPEDTATTIACPPPFKVLLAVLISAAFLANNMSILHLFHRREGYENAEIWFLPKKMREASRRVESETAGAGGGARGGGGGGEAAQNDEESSNASYQRRIFLYFMLMLVFLDLPLLICRLELWRKKYWKLDIFVAKNLKNITDVLLLMMRVDRKEKNQSGSSSGAGGGGGGSPGAGSRHNGYSSSQSLI